MPGFHGEPVHPLRAVVDELELPLVRPFSTSFGTEEARRILLLTLEDADGVRGFSECVAGRDPYYSYESVPTVLEVLERYLLPSLAALGNEVTPPRFLQAADRIRGHPMAKALVEMALWDLSARRSKLPLQKLLASGRPVRERVEVGVSVGLASSPRELVRQLEEYAGQGYQRLKLKVEPGRDQDFVRAARESFPDSPLWIDANQAYAAKDVDALATLCRSASLSVVEQPFGEDELLLHASLAQELRGTPTLVCLDESVTSLGRFELALQEGAVGCLNVKPGRVGGLSRSLELHDRAETAGVPVWCGGMLETGIGRAHDLHLASLPGFRLPADLSASDRYWKEDLIEPPFRLGPGSTLPVPTGDGIGVEPEEERLSKVRLAQRVLPLNQKL